jgi:alpha-beta hydrolase superfamily lysophospholipase
MDCTTIGGHRRVPALAEYRLFPGAAHNLMMEPDYRETAVAIHHWLQKQGVK